MQLIDSGGRNGRMRIRVGAFRFGNLPGSKLLAIDKLTGEESSNGIRRC
jgi:hypothetical protein